MNEKHWLRLDEEGGWQSIVPNNDIQPHSKLVLHYPDGAQEADLAGVECPCNPSVDFKDKLIVHNSFDGREANETKNINGFHVGKGHCFACHNDYEDQNHLLQCHEKGLKSTPYGCEKCKKGEGEDWREPTVGEIERWIEKLSLLTSKGAKILHVKNLLLSERQRLAGKIRGMKKLTKTGRRKQCDCQSYDGCGCKVDDFNEALESAAKLVEGEGEQGREDQ